MSIIIKGVDKPKTCWECAKMFDIVCDGRNCPIEECGEEFVFGYPKGDLLLFAVACREAGISNEDLDKITFDLGWAMGTVKNQTERAIAESLKLWIQQMERSNE